MKFGNGKSLIIMNVNFKEKYLDYKKKSFRIVGKELFWGDGKSLYSIIGESMDLYEGGNSKVFLCCLLFGKKLAETE